MDVVATILSGEVDHRLPEIREAIRTRRDVVDKLQFQALRVGDQVRFSPETGKGLAGELATIVEKRRTRVLVKIGSGEEYTAPASILEAV